MHRSLSVLTNILDELFKTSFEEYNNLVLIVSPF